MKRKAEAWYIRARLADHWSCACILEGERRVLAEAVAALLTERHAPTIFEAHSRQQLDTPAKVTRAVEQSRTEWDRLVLAAYIEEARASLADVRLESNSAAHLAAHAARRSLVDLESAILNDPQPNEVVARAAKLDVATIEAIRAGHRLTITLDMKDGS